MTSWNTSNQTPFGWDALSAPVQQEAMHRAAWKAGVIGALNMAATILAARVIVLVAVVGGILLTWTALADPQLYRLLSLGVYGALIVLPVVWLSSGERG